MVCIEERATVADKDLVDRAVTKFGVTDSTPDAGWVLEDGRMLNMRSGTEIVHESVATLFPAAEQPDFYHDILQMFSKRTHAVRIRVTHEHGVSLGLSLEHQPVLRQWISIKRAVAKGRGVETLYYDILDAAGDLVKSGTIQNARQKDVDKLAEAMLSKMKS